MNLYLTGESSNPIEVTKALAVGYVDPVLEGQNIIFTCPSGQILNGSITSTCMENGEWEPDPQEVQCIGVLELITPIAGATTTLRILTVLV